MIKKFLLIFFLFLFAAQFVLAQDTEIKIKTPEFTEIHLTVLDPDADYSAYAIYKQTSDAYGDAPLINSTEESSENKSGFLGSFLNFQKKEKTEKTAKTDLSWLYYIGALVLLFAIGFFIFKTYNSPA